MEVIKTRVPSEQYKANYDRIFCPAITKTKPKPAKPEAKRDARQAA